MMMAIAFIVFYKTVYIPEYEKIDNLLFEIDTFDESQKIYEMKLDAENFPLRHISWFDLKEVYVQIHTSIFFLCDIATQNDRWKEACALSTCYNSSNGGDGPRGFKAHDFGYSYDYYTNYYEKDDINLCLLEKLGIDYCLHIHDSMQAFICERPFDLE